MKKNAYGNIEDIVVDAVVVTPRGTLNQRSSAPRVSSGPSLQQLVLGSEGTLGIITQVTLKVKPLPEVKSSETQPSTRCHVVHHEDRQYQILLRVCLGYRSLFLMLVVLLKKKRTYRAIALKAISIVKRRMLFRFTVDQYASTCRCAVLFRRRYMAAWHFRHLSLELRFSAMLQCISFNQQVFDLWTRCRRDAGRFSERHVLVISLSGCGRHTRLLF